MDFDWRKMSKLTFPAGNNETQYLQYETNGTWTACDKERICVIGSSAPGNAVGRLGAKLHPINAEDRRHLIENLEEWIKRNQDFLEKYGKNKSDTDVKDAHKSIKRLEREIARLKALELP